MVLAGTEAIISFASFLFFPVVRTVAPEHREFGHEQARLEWACNHHIPSNVHGNRMPHFQEQAMLHVYALILHAQAALKRFTVKALTCRL